MNTDFKKFGQLSIDERCAMFRAHQEGKKIQVYTSIGRWIDFFQPSWGEESIYRIAPELPTINWDHVAPEYVAMATDGVGKTYLCNVADLFPSATHDRWTSDAVGYLYCNAQIFASFKPGNCHWTESLVLRPEVRSMKIGESVKRFLNHYSCYNCPATWQNESESTNDDRCPECNTATSPYRSEDL